MTRAVAVLFALIAGIASAVAVSAQCPDDSAEADPDVLYAGRAQLECAVRAATVWRARLAADPQDFEAAWKLSRACYWLGAHVAQSDRRAQYQTGIDAGRAAIRIDGARPDGHFWLAANMGTLAESSGLWTGLRYRGAVKRELEAVLAIDRSYGEGLADRALGRWYLRVPGIFGGSKQKSIAHLQRALTYDPTAAATHLFLAETYLAMDRRDDAEAELQQVLDAPLHPDWVPEVLEFKDRAAALLRALRGR